MCQVNVPIANLYQSVAADNLTSQLLYGERVDIIDRSGNMALIENSVDHYRGYLQSACLCEPPPAVANPVMRVSQAATLLYNQPDIKSLPVARLPYAASLSVGQCDDPAFIATTDGHFVWAEHVRQSLHQYGHDLVVQAQQLFAQAPYLWGGRTPDGVDCSALVQLSAMSIGVNLPRDSGEQFDFLHRSETHRSIPFDRRRRGDLVYWPGHVALLINRHSVFHATAFRMQTCVEQLAAVTARAGRPTGFFRLHGIETEPD